MRRFALLLIALAACSEKKLEHVHAQYEPPNGFDFVREDPGPPPSATFRPGLVIARLGAKDVAGDDPKLVQQKVLKTTGVDASCELATSRDGTLNLGPVTRLEFTCNDGERALVYVAPRQQGAIVVTFHAPESSYGPLEAKVERSLSSLRADP